MELGVFELLITLLIILLSLFLLKSWNNLNYWKKRGVPGPKPLPIFGNFAQVFFKKLSHTELFHAMYKKWKNHPVIGIFKGQKPMLLIHDLDIAKNILIKDFNVFSTRGLDCNEKIDPLLPTLFSLDGERWKILRSKLSPIFTSGKLKHMVDLIIECADTFDNYLSDNIGEESVMECRDVSAKFTTDIIGSCIFGINTNALTREDSDFRRIGRNVFPSGYLTIFTRHLRDTFPELYRLLRLRQFSKEVSDFFISTIKEALEFREKEGFVRHDLIDLLLEIKKNHNHGEIELSDELLAAQAFGFFIGGADTSSLGIAYTLYELAHAPEVQEKLRTEIMEILEKHGGKVSYEMLNDTKYLDMVVQDSRIRIDHWRIEDLLNEHIDISNQRIHQVWDIQCLNEVFFKENDWFSETLRKNPIITALERQTTRDCHVPGTDLTLEKGIKVYVPCYAFHHDPEYYPDPHVFDPERFSEEAKARQHPMAWLAFGDGPKNCIGGRFALLGVKIGIITILKKYRLEKTELSPMPFEIDRGSFLLVPKNDLQLKFKLVSQK